MLSTGSRFSPGFPIVEQGVIDELRKLHGGDLEFYSEYLDIVRFPSKSFHWLFRDYLRNKYVDDVPDVIVLVFVGNLVVARQLLNDIFPGIPVVAVGLTEEELSRSKVSQDLTGIVQRSDPGGTIELILRLQPEIQRILLIGGVAEVDRQVMARATLAARSFAGRVEFEVWDKRSMVEVLQAVTVLSPRTAILFTRMFRDGAGRAVNSSQAVQAVAKVSNVPVYLMSDPGLGTGAVGGSVANIPALGKRAGELAERILSGAVPNSLPLEILTNGVPIFDWRALRRWGISESRLPPDSIIRFRPPSMWEQYRWYIIGALVLFLLQAVLIAGLVFSRIRRRRAEAELRASQELMEMATNAGGLGLWSRDLKNANLWANEALRYLCGFRQNDTLQGNDVLARIHPDDSARVLSEVQSAQAANLPFEGEFRILLPDGKERWALAKGRTVHEPSGRGARRMGVVMDITARKQAEEALEKERAFLRQVIDIDPNFIFAKDRDGRFTLVNQAVADAYGTTVEGLIGKTDADFNPNRDEVEYFHRMDLEVIDNLQERFVPEEHLTDARGEIRWLQTVKRPIGGKNGVADQVLGASTDITRRKLMEIELQRQREDLAHVTRVSLMGELTASLAHELNQPLTAILSNAQAAQRFLMNQAFNLDEVRDILKDIVEDNNRAAEIIRKIRALVRKEQLTFARLDLPAVIRDVLSLVHSDADLRNVQVDYQPGDGVPSVRGDRIQLQQVLLNLSSTRLTQ